MTQKLIDYHKTKMCLAGAEGRAEDYKFHKAAIELFEKLSLPSNLDEAAVEFSKDVASGHIYKDLCAGFKAGAEWMVEQFQKIEGDLVDWYSTSDGKDYCCGVKTIDAFEVPEGFYIRKKQ